MVQHALVFVQGLKKRHGTSCYQRVFSYLFSLMWWSTAPAAHCHGGLCHIDLAQRHLPRCVKVAARVQNSAYTPLDLLQGRDALFITTCKHTCVAPLRHTIASHHCAVPVAHTSVACHCLTLPVLYRYLLAPLLRTIQLQGCVTAPCRSPMLCCCATLGARCNR